MLKAMCMSVMQGSRYVKPMLQSRFPLMSKFRARSIITPEQDVFNKPSMFNPQVILKFYECLPIVIYTSVGFACEVLWTIRLALTRDDVCYGQKMACEYEDPHPENPSKPPIRKLIPLFVITGSAVVGLGVWIVRSIITRDDVRYTKSGKMLCEVVDPGNPAPVRKFRVYNQKYEVSPRLLEALKALEEPVEEEPKKKTK